MTPNSFLPGVEARSEEPRFWPILLSLLLLVLQAPGRAAEPVFARQRVLFLGDSITQNGAYVTFAEYYLNKNYPTLPFDIISIGLSSETVSGLSEKTHPFPRPDLHERLWAALDLIKPTVVVACYGMNDGIYHPFSDARFQAFQTGIEKLVAKSKAVGAKVILLTPPPFEPQPGSLRPQDALDFGFNMPYENYDAVLARYAAWEKTLASESVTVVDLHSELAAFKAEKRKTQPTFRLTGDGIHPDTLGHLRMARALLKATGATVAADAGEAELARIEKDPLYVLVRSHRETRSDAWLPYVGYTREAVVKTASVADAEEKAQQLQTEIDRLRKGH